MVIKLQSGLSKTHHNLQTREEFVVLQPGTARSHDLSDVMETRLKNTSDGFWMGFHIRT